jgi:hypothetical protein
MAGIKHISEIYKKQGESRLRELLAQEVRINEKFDAYRFSFEKNHQNYKLTFYGKNGKTALNKVDRTISNLYESAIEYIESLPYEIKRDIPARHRFGFSWFPTKNPLGTEYERRPKNGLVLTDITIRDKNKDIAREVKESEVFQRWSKIFNVENSTPVYEGKLDESIIESIVSIAKNEAQPALLTESFDTKGLLNTLHPNIEALVFESGDQLFKVTHKEEVIVTEKRSQMFDVLLLDILEHVEKFNILGIKCAAHNIDESYIEAVSELFNNYVDVRGKDYLQYEIQKPKFLEKSGSFNRKWVKNPKTRVLLEKDSRYEYLFTVFLANFRKTKYAGGLLNETMANRFNAKIEELDKAIGDDYSFLEFSTILKEDREEMNEAIKLETKANTIEIPKPQEEPEPTIDYAKAVQLLVRFFDPERNSKVGEIPANVLIVNGGMITKRTIDAAEDLMNRNQHKCFLVHDDHLTADCGVSAENIEKVLAKISVDREDLFHGYHTMKNPTLSDVFKTLRPSFEPVIVSTHADTSYASKELDGLHAIYADPALKQLKIHQYTDSKKDAVQKSIADGVYKDFCELTPEQMWPYWNEIKSSFERNTYK